MNWTYTHIYVIIYMVIKMEKNIKNWENYTIDEFGNVKNSKTNKYLKGALNNKGYLRVELHKNKKLKKFFVHRLVAEYFIENPLNKKQVNHKDGNKQNNRVDNLEWVTNQENRNHALKHKLTKNLCGEDAPWSKLTKKDVLYIRQLYNNDKTNFNTKELSKKYNVSYTQILMVAKRKSWKNV